MTNQPIRPIAFYLPQYHPIAENNTWWGPGFTEWTNVAKAKPLFEGHYQPHLPADLGFYDLRLPETRQAQADLAQQYGIYGFCYYHYWFNGRRLLERPFQEVLDSKQPGFPFCLCWANENWTRAWDGFERDVLLKQHYGQEDDRQHIQWLINAFRDERYIRINGKPLFLVYRVSQLPNPLQTATIWRDAVLKAGLGDLYLCAVRSLQPRDRVDPSSIGFDAAIEFQPDWFKLPKPIRVFGEGNKVYDYSEVVETMIEQPLPSYKCFPSIMTNWDNTARRIHNAAIFDKATPQEYQRWLSATINKLKPEHPDENLIFINAWNEWAEGAHLEPDQKWGHAYLKATKNALQQHQTYNPTSPKGIQNITGISTNITTKSNTYPVSICIPTYNGSAYLSETLQSVLSQTRTDFELLIVDDRSTDETESVVSAFQHKQIKFVKNPTRLGLVGNWNRCLELAQGEYICIFHQDDVMLPDNIAKKVQLLADNPSVGMAYSNVRQIDTYGKSRSNQWQFKPKAKKIEVYQGCDFFQQLITDVNIVCCPSVVIKRDVYDKLGGFDPLLPYTADWEMWLRIALFYDVSYLAEPLIKYRRHEGMETLNFLGAKGLEHAYRAKQRILNKYPEHIPNHRVLQQQIIEEYTTQALANAQECYKLQNFSALTAYLTTAAYINQISQSQLEWCLSLLYQFDPLPSHASGLNASRYKSQAHLGYFEVIDSLCGQDIGLYIPITKIIKGLGFKLTQLPGLSWLYRYRDSAKRLLDSVGR